MNGNDKSIDQGYFSSPLADRIRPKRLTEFIGQEHLVGKGKVLRLMIENKQPFSIIFWGPPGVGKTTLARIVAQETKSFFIEKSAVSARVADIRRIADQAKERLAKYGQKTIFFLDEIHRFNKAQQDSLLPYVEDGTIILIGATTENPSFEVIGPLLSRSRVLILNPLEEDELNKILNRGLEKLDIEITPKAEKLLLSSANADARTMLNILEVAHTLYCSSKNNKGSLTLQYIKEALQDTRLLYDRAGEEHYNTISSYIKSMRAGNVDAALYYLARMVEAGEDPLFIARRMVVFASEDVATPTALVVANAVFRACETVGYPECQENLAAGTVYLAQAPKDRRAYEAYMRALSDVKKYGNLPIPLHLRNAPTKLMKDLGYGKDYQPYTKEDLLPEKLKGKKYFFSKKKKN
ncbi:MAG: recombination factor protein RarA [Microgenomates bacterium 39_6]|nr:MAG: recombination factor protein RarA [Microgenomates bacterium 39_6]